MVSSERQARWGRPTVSLAPGIKAAIAASTELQERDALKTVSLAEAMTAALLARGVADPAAQLASEMGVLALKRGFATWTEGDHDDTDELAPHTLAALERVACGERVAQRRRVAGYSSAVNTSAKTNPSRSTVAPTSTGDRGAEDGTGVDERVEFAVLAARIDVRREARRAVRRQTGGRQTTGRAGAGRRRRGSPRHPRR